MTNTDKIVDFERKDADILQLAIERRESGNYEGALTTLFWLEEKGCKLISVFSEIAITYMNLGLYLNATKYWFRYLAHAPKSKCIRAYNALGACYYYLEDYIASGYYFEKQLATESVEVQEFDDVMMEFYESFNEVTKPEFYVCYPENKISSERLIDEAELLILKEEFDAAIQTLEKVDREDERYSEAQSRIASCYYYKKDYDKAIETLKYVVSLDETEKCSLINLIGMMFISGRGDEAKPYFEMCEKLDFSANVDCYKLAASFCDAGCDEKAEKYLDIAISYAPYDVNTMFLLAMVCFNLKKYKKAEKYFSLCYRITLSPTAKYYIGLCTEALVDETKFKRLDYMFNVPKEEVSDRIDLIQFIYEHDEKVIAKIPKNIVLDLCEWVFSFDSKAQEPLAEAMLRSKSPYIRRFFLNILIHPMVGDEVKSVIIAKLVETGYDKKIGIVLGHIFTKLQLLRAEFDKEKNELFNKAYSIVFGKLAPLEPDKSYKIRDGAYELYYELKDNGNLKKVSDLNALAGAIAVFSGLKSASKKSAVAQYFMTTKDKIKAIIDLSADSTN